MKMELSIIVPVYNGEKYILNCLNSIYCQVLPKFEVIIVNDGSDEICLDIIKKFVSYLNLNQYKFSKKEVSDIFNISRSTLYRWLDE